MTVTLRGTEGLPLNPPHLTSSRRPFHYAVPARDWVQRPHFAVRTARASEPGPCLLGGPAGEELTAQTGRPKGSSVGRITRSS